MVSIFVSFPKLKLQIKCCASESIVSDIMVVGYGWTYCSWCESSKINCFASKQTFTFTALYSIEDAPNSGFVTRNAIQYEKPIWFALKCAQAIVIRLLNALNRYDDEYETVVCVCISFLLLLCWSYFCFMCIDMVLKNNIMPLWQTTWRLCSDGCWMPGIIMANVLCSMILLHFPLCVTNHPPQPTISSLSHFLQRFFFVFPFSFSLWKLPLTLHFPFPRPILSFNLL